MDYLNAILYGSAQLVSENSISAVLATIACVLLIYIYYDSKNKHNYWNQRGIRGPKPVPLFGNIIDLITGNRLKKELEWVKEYGKVYGLYQGTKPLLIVADPEVVLQICIKDFEAFANHVSQEFVSKYFKASLFSSHDGHWKRGRALMSPTFTSSKIRRMFRFLDGCADDLVQCFGDQIAAKRAKDDQRDGAVVDVKSLYGNYTMDAIATCCYGLQLERAGSKNVKAAAQRDEFVKIGLKVFKFSIVRLIIQFALPDSLLRLLNFQLNTDKDMEPLASKLKLLIDQRRQSSSSARKFDDYLQLLMDAKLGDQLELDEMDLAENHHVAQTGETALEDQRRFLKDLEDPESYGSKTKTSLTDLEILSNATTILVVGLETTSTHLTHCTYALAFHQEIQDRLYGELMRFAQWDEAKRRFSFDYDTITSCKYLDACLSEALRLLSPVLQMDRCTGRDYYLKKYDLCIPRGSQVQLAYYAVMNDPDYWPEPERFNPERFMPGEREKIVPGSYCAFGLGPRHCFGMRFSLTESKLALAKLVVNYQFKPAPGTQFPAEPQRLFGLHNINTPYVTAISRL